MTLGSLVDALSSKKGMLLLVPAVLLVSVALAIGRNPPVVAAKSDVTAKSDVAAPPEKVAAAQPSSSQRKEIEAVIKEYLTNNPEILLEMQNVLQAKMDKLAAERVAALIKNNTAAIFRPAFSPVVGNAKGDVPVLEFFDYNCGYCKKVIGDVVQLVEKDKQVRVILKELPILSEGSKEAARVALAAKMQGKYWEFHRAMLESKGEANEASALRVAEKTNLDMAKLKKDMASAEVKKEIEETRALAQKLGVEGTPYFMVGDRIIPGAPENLLERMTKLVAEVRKDGCKVC